MITFSDYINKTLKVFRKIKIRLILPKFPGSGIYFIWIFIDIINVIHIKKISNLHLTITFYYFVSECYRRISF